MKRTISILLVLVMLLGICPAALADWGDDGWDDSSSWGDTPSTGSSTATADIAVVIAAVAAIAASGAIIVKKKH